MLINKVLWHAVGGVGAYGYGKNSVFPAINTFPSLIATPINIPNSQRRATTSAILPQVAKINNS